MNPENTALTTRHLDVAATSSAGKGRKSGEKSGGASRIPCPSPVVVPSPGEAGQVSSVSGLDKLMVSCWVEGHDELLQLLRDFKEEFQDEKLCGSEVMERSIDLGWEEAACNMSRTGAGKYPYKLQTGDVILLFSNHKPTASFPNCRIEIGSMSCWSPGWQQVFDRFLALLKHWGGSIRKQHVMQFDITVDLLEVDFTKTGLINIHRWIARARDQNPKYEDYVPNYVAFGKGDFMFKVYDKLNELKANPDKKDFFLRLWTERCGCAPEHVTRFEFQCRKAGELGIVTVGDLASKLDAVWQYCVGSDDENGWCRFCAKEISESVRRNKNHQRHVPAVLWEMVRAVRFGAARTFTVKRQKPLPQFNIDLLQKQAAGCLLSVCALLGMHPDDYVGHAVQSYNVITAEINKKYKKNRNEYVRKIKTRYNAAYSFL